MGSDPQEGARPDGFSVRKEPAKFNDALDDFLRYRDKREWERAFRSLETLSEGRRDAMVSAGNGFYLPSRQRIISSLTSLPREGKEAFQLFYDAKARQLFERANDPESARDASVDEISVLREIFDKYLISTVGDEAADRLGDAQFEAGDFQAAAATWRIAIQAFGDEDLSRLRLQVKRCAALARAGHWTVFDSALREVRKESPDGRLKIAGKEVVAVEYLESLRKTLATTLPTTHSTTSPVLDLGPLQLPRDDKPAWQIQLLDSTLSRKLNEAINNNNNWGIQPAIRTVVPAVAADDARVYVNWFGVVFAADVKTGKMIWRSRKFPELGERFQQLAQMAVDYNCYTVAVHGDRLLVTGINLDRLNNYEEPIKLVCMTASTGKFKWSSNSGSLASWNFAGTPVTAGEVIYAAARQGTGTDISLLAIDAEKGSLMWQVPLGTAQAVSNYRGGIDVPPTVVVPAGPSVYVVTNSGALVAVDTTSRRIEWAFTYEAPPVAPQERFWGGSDMKLPEPTMPAAAYIDGSTMYLKEENGSAVYAVDLSGPSLLWRRPLDRANSIASLPGGQMLSVGQDLGAIDAGGGGRTMKWSSPLPSLMAPVRPVMDEQCVMAFVPRGIYAYDLADGDRIGIFRGADRDSIGGTLLRAPGRLISVSNLAVTAYATPDAGN